MAASGGGVPQLQIGGGVPSRQLCLYKKQVIFKDILTEQKLLTMSPASPATDRAPGGVGRFRDR
jgi:hypothetical protein